MTSKRADSFAVVEGVQSRFFQTTATASAIGHNCQARLWWESYLRTIWLRPPQIYLESDCFSAPWVPVDGSTDSSLIFTLATFRVILCPVGWGCRIHRLLLCRGVRHPSTSVLDIILNNLMVRFKLWGMLSTPSLPSLPGPLWPGVVAPDVCISLRLSICLSECMSFALSLYLHYTVDIFDLVKNRAFQLKICLIQWSHDSPCNSPGLWKDIIEVFISAIFLYLLANLQLVELPCSRLYKALFIFYLRAITSYSCLLLLLNTC